MSLTATCATIALAIASAKGGEVINLKGNCPKITIKNMPAKRVTINAGGARVAGLDILPTAGNIRWRSGTITAPAGMHGFAGDGYAVKNRGTNVRLDGVLITDAKKGIVSDSAKMFTIADSRFLRYGEDGIIAANTKGLTIVRNRFAEIVGKPTECNVSGVVTFGLSSRDCAARGGTWKDGYHKDAVQLRHAVTDTLIAYNRVEGDTQGLTQMDTTGDLPLERVVIEHNMVFANAHQITLGNCINCTIRWNVVRRFSSAGLKAVIRPGMAKRCGNDTVDEKKDAVCS